MKTLRQLDFDAMADRYTPVVGKIAREHRVRRPTARRWFIEMLKFLDVCSQTDSSQAPPVRVDKAWHTFILFTREYSEYCTRRFGSFIHHEPWESSDASAYEFTYLEAKARFGDLDRRIWPRPRSERSHWLTGGACGGIGGCGGGGCGGGGF
jgi:hypothetical protein